MCLYGLEITIYIFTHGYFHIFMLIFTYFGDFIMHYHWYIGNNSWNKRYLELLYNNWTCYNYVQVRSFWEAWNSTRSATWSWIRTLMASHPLYPMWTVNLRSPCGRIVSVNHWHNEPSSNLTDFADFHPTDIKHWKTNKPEKLNQRHSVSTYSGPFYYFSYYKCTVYML